MFQNRMNELTIIVMLLLGMMSSSVLVFIFLSHE